MPTVDQRIPLLLAMAAALAMLAVTAWQGYRFWQAEASRAPVAKSVTTPSQAPAEAQAPDVALGELRLFGDPRSDQLPSGSRTENLPETNLSLFLRGVLAAGGDYPASALIEGPEGDTEVYLVGERLPGNARLRTVLSNRIIIERGGKLENLYFPQTEARKGLNVTREVGQPEPETTIPNAQRAPASGANSDTQNRREDIRRRLEERRQELQESN